jgi:hypothetical protein
LQTSGERKRERKRAPRGALVSKGVETAFTLPRPRRTSEKKVSGKQDAVINYTIHAPFFFVQSAKKARKPGQKRRIQTSRCPPDTGTTKQVRAGFFFWSAALFRRFISIVFPESQSGGRAPQSEMGQSPFAGDFQKNSPLG